MITWNVCAFAPFELLRPVDLIRTSDDAVRTIFKQSHRKVEHCHLLPRDAKDNFVFARPRKGSAMKQTHETGTGAFDDMFHSFDAAKDKQRIRCIEG